MNAVSLSCLIAEDHPSVTRSLRELLLEWGLVVVASSDNGPDALHKIEELRPTLAIVDIRLPRLSGIEVIRQAAKTAPETAMVVYTGVADRALVQEAIDAGAKGIVLKEAPLDDLRRALMIVAEGGTYIDPVAGGQLVEHSLIGSLTPRERDVLRLVAQGLSYEQIGKELFISSETVRAHVAKAARKLGVRTKTEAVVQALRAGLIS
jgi:DNA-binding NarL/FixJ family response regulator